MIVGRHILSLIEQTVLHPTNQAEPTNLSKKQTKKERGDDYLVFSHPHIILEVEE